MVRRSTTYGPLAPIAGGTARGSRPLVAPGPALALSRLLAGWDAGTGPFVYDESFTETATLADALSVAAVFSATLSEAVAANDGVGIATTFASIVAEAAALAESLTESLVHGGNTYNESFTEALNAADALVVALSAVASISEAASISDSLAPQAQLREALSEAIAAADALSAASTMRVTLTEALAAADLLTSAAVMSVTLTETASLADSLSEYVIPAGGGGPRPSLLALLGVG